MGIGIPHQDPSQPFDLWSLYSVLNFWLIATKRGSRVANTRNDRGIDPHEVSCQSSRVMEE